MKLVKPALAAFALYAVAAPALGLAASLAAPRTLTTVRSEPVRGMPTIEITLNGHGPFRFAIDTGAPGPVHVDSKLARQLRLPLLRQESVGDPSGENAISAPIYGLRRLSIGRITFAGQEAIAHDFSQIAGGGLSGMFGMETFKDRILVLDYAADRVAVESGALPPADGRTVFDIVIRPDGLIEAPLTVAGRQVRAILDTGNVSRTGLSIPTALVGELTKGDGRVTGKLRTVNNVRDVYTATLAGPVTLGGVALPVTEASYPTAGEAAVNLGSAALRGARLRLDQKNRRLEVTWPKGAPAA